MTSLYVFIVLHVFPQKRPVSSSLYEILICMLRGIMFVYLYKFFHSAPCFLQSEILTNSSWSFEIRLARVYTRAVFGRFEESMKAATAFRIVEDPDRGRHCWLVRHISTCGKIVWGQHQFQVTVNEATGLLTCECKQWEHTRMSLGPSMHLFIGFYTFLLSLLCSIYHVFCIFSTDFPLLQ
jgi:hypothetical protein